MDWISDDREGTLLTMMDISFLREYISNIFSANFVIECRQGLRKIVGTFTEHYEAENAYQGELLKLMTIHLILKAVETLHPGIGGEVEIWSNCLGALG